MNIGQIALVVALFCNILIMVFIMSRLVHVLISTISIVRADIKHPKYNTTGYMITGEDE